MSYQIYKKQLKSLKEDNIHGASYLCRQLLKVFAEANGSLKRKEYRKLVGQLSDWRPLMGNLINIISVIENCAEDSFVNITAELAMAGAEIEQAQAKTITQAAAVIKKHLSIATISYSSLVADSILKAHTEGWRGNILIAESRPMMEGRLLAQRLAESFSDDRIGFGTDCQVISLVPKIDAVFIGADMVSTGFFINKAGSASMHRALSRGKKMYVIADSTKYFIPRPVDIDFPQRLSTEVWPDHPAKICVINGYFEIIKYSPNIMFINEFGIWTGAKVNKYLEKYINLL